MANANPANRKPKQEEVADKPAAPIIEYYGEGAKEVKFEVDPNAKIIRVYGDGRIVTDY